MNKFLSSGLSDVVHCFHAIPFTKLVGQWATEGQWDFDDVCVEHLVSLIAIAQTLGSLAQMTKNVLRPESKS
jgi:hypothetical protein